MVGVLMMERFGERLLDVDVLRVGVFMGERFGERLLLWAFE
jgi:hypothetical protein